jgi:glycogen debranching enzyme
MNEVRTAKWTHATPHSGPEDYYIEATKSLVEKPLRTLKHDALFAVFDTQGDLNVMDPGAEGLYFQDTRFLSRVVLTVGGKPPLLLGSVVLDDNGALVIDMTNADLHDRAGEVQIPRDSVFVSRLKLLHVNTCYDRIHLRRYERFEEPVPVRLDFDADFADLFEVRGEQRSKRGKIEATVLDRRSCRFTYLGLDGIERSTTLWFDPAPASLSERAVEWCINLDKEEQCAIVVKISCSVDSGTQIPEPPDIVAAYRTRHRTSRQRLNTLGRVCSSNELINEMMGRAAADINMLLTETEFGLYPYAGVPWYSTIFGRDGILTAMELLWVAPDIARGVLKALALTQAQKLDQEADAEPGKIIHEMREGEMARLGEVPFRRYYGSVDATPLFVWLAGEYLQRSGDIETIRFIWPNIEAALGWIKSKIDRNGFLTYRRATERGLVNQGWKDSFDSIFHADGQLAAGPIALCEVQAYVFAALSAGATMAMALGDPARSATLASDAELMRELFEEKFWLDDLDTYALAIDGQGLPCRVRSSNAGHALFAGIASPERAAKIARELCGRDFFSGWGVRTIASGEARYNPMSYHNGSVWPHDNAVIAMGFARYGHKDEAAQLTQGLFDAATWFEFRRLPELFCGFSRRRRRGPTPYPVACSPQAWAAAAPFALLQAVAGLELRHDQESVRLNDPVLPRGIDNIELPKLRVAGSSMRLRLSRSGEDVVAAVLERSGSAALVVKK